MLESIRQGTSFPTHYYLLATLEILEIRHVLHGDTSLVFGFGARIVSLFCLSGTFYHSLSMQAKKERTKEDTNPV